jgi:hypothetical protein
LGRVTLRVESEKSTVFTVHLPIRVFNPSTQIKSLKAKSRELPRGSTREGNCFVHEHDGDVVADGVEELAVAANEAAVNFFFDELAGAIFQGATGDLLVDLGDERWFGQPDGLVSFRAAQNLQKIRVEHSQDLRAWLAA